MKLYFEGTDFKCLILNAWCKVALSKLKSKKLPTSKNKAQQQTEQQQQP